MRERAVDREVGSGDEHRASLVSRSVKQYRLNRLFHATSGRCFDVAVDHGFSASPRCSPASRTWRRRSTRSSTPRPTRSSSPSARPTCCSAARAATSPRSSCAPTSPNVYAPRAARRALFSQLIDDPVGQARAARRRLRRRQPARRPRPARLRRDCLRTSIAACAPSATAPAMPLMVEPLVFEPGSRRLRRRRRRRQDLRLVRQAVELGADVIKADPTDDLADYHRVVTVARRAAARARRRPGHRRGDPRAHARGARAGRGRDRLRPQRDPARTTRRR